MNEPLAQQILDLVYRDSEVRRTYKDSLTDWILDTQSRTAPLDPTALVEYLAVRQPDLLDRLKSNLRIHDDLARTLESVDPR